MADIWLPGFERWELSGVPGGDYDEFDDPKALLHSTEGTSVAGAVQAYRSYPPHAIVDPAVRRKCQHIPLNRSAYALWNADADDSRCYQVEIVGFAGRMHLLSDADLKWLGEEVFRPLHEYGGVPYVVVWKQFRRDGEMPYALADASSPLRLTQAELDSFSGFLGHQHVPGDIHWDPGGLKVQRALDFAQNKEELPVQIMGQDGKWYPAEQVFFWYGQDFTRVKSELAAIRALVTADKDLTAEQVEAIVSRAVTEATPTAEQNAAALEASLLPTVREALEAVQDMDNLDEAKRTAAELKRLLADALGAGDHQA